MKLKKLLSTLGIVMVVAALLVVGMPGMVLASPATASREADEGEAEEQKAREAETERSKRRSAGGATQGGAIAPPAQKSTCGSTGGTTCDSLHCSCTAPRMQKNIRNSRITARYAKNR